MVKTNIQTFSGEVEILSNLHVGNYLTANGTASNVLDITGNVGATFFVGDGGFLSNIATTLNDIVANPGGNTVSNTLVFESGADVTSNTAIVTYANVGISISNTEPTGEFQLSIGSNIFVNTHAANVLTVVGAIGSDLFIGDGGLLSNIATTIDQIIDQGNTVSNTLQLISGMDATSNTGLVTHKDVGISISNTAPTGEFQFGVGSNLFVNTYSSNVLSIEGNVNAQKMTLGTISVTSAYGLNHVTAQGSATGDTISLTNATTGLEVTSNITAGGNVTAETVITSANVEVGNRLKFASNVFVDDLRIADLAANLVTYDKTTGELMDSGGLFANKLAVVSVQPPSALTANATTIAKHGTYTVTTSSLAENSNAWNAFDGDSAVEWTSSPTVGHLYSAGESTYAGTSNLFTGNYIQPGVSSAGEWLAVEFPYKTTLRHMKLTPPATLQRYPASANVYATNDSLTWTEVAQWGDVDPVTSSNVQTVVVNATESFKKYAMVVTKANGGADNVALAKWDLFAESFSIDGGQISMAQQPVTGGETVMEQSGPHSRLPKAMPLRKFPEIEFQYGKLDANETTFTYTQAGYTVKGTNSNTGQNSGPGPGRTPWKAFSDLNDGGQWQPTGFSHDTGNNGSADNVAAAPVFGPDDTKGAWVSLELPKKIKLQSVYVKSVDPSSSTENVRIGKLYGSNNNSDWVTIKDDYTLTYSGSDANDTVNSTTAYKYIVFQIRATGGSTQVQMNKIRYYGYEEDPPLGDTSVDTTFTSIMNTPQTTGAQVYVDGSLGETFTNRVVGPTVSNTHTTYVSTEKYWELSGNVESNVTLEANTFLSGDAPHSLSMWFNSSNLEANVSNTCVFSVSDQEKLDSMNLDLQSNTWHNLTYAYQGEGGSRVTYLDGRKVAEDQAEDTFGEYPPFAMTGYSQGGYVVSANNFYTNANNERDPWRAYDGIDNSDATHNWGTTIVGTAESFEKTGDYLAKNNTGGNPDTFVDETGTSHRGHWNKIKLPYKLRVESISINCALNYNRRAGKVAILGSNDDEKWYLLKDVTTNLDFTTVTPQIVHMENNKNKGFKYLILVVKTAPGADGAVTIREISYQGHRENDLVRLPDPTNVLKYPHIAMTGPAQRGYVASASSEYEDGYNSHYQLWKAFDGSIANDYGAWLSDINPSTYDGSGNAANVTGNSLSGITGGVGSRLGAWLKLELPHKIKLTEARLYGRWDAIYERIDAGYIYGSNDDTNWTQIGEISVSGISSGNLSTYTDTVPLVITSTDTTNYYKYFIVQPTSLTHANGYAGIGQMEYYGTEEATPVPLQIGGGNIDKVANFRVYDKFIGEDQALEIWDAQKDTFRGVKNSMTLQKGRLGIGTTEPEGRLAVLDEPHTPEEFPPRPMTGYKNYFDGHGEFCASGSSEVSGLQAWEAFNDTRVNNDDGWVSSVGIYTLDNYTSVNPAVAANINGVYGEWLELKLPYKITLDRFIIQSRNSAGGGQEPEAAPGDGNIWGSNDGINWTLLTFFTGLTYGGATHQGLPETVQVNSTTPYSYFRLQPTKRSGTFGSDSYVSIGNLSYFGTREQGQSVLHDGQLTLTKSLNVPRIGPALDADDTPRRDRLVVEYNTSTNPTFEGAVRDTSGRGNDGAFYGGASYDATEKAWTNTTQYGTGDYVYTKTHLTSGDFPFAMSFWVKMTQAYNGIMTMVMLGSNATNKGMAIDIYNAGNIYWYGYDGSALLWNTAGTNQTSDIFPIGKWVHVVAVHHQGSGAATDDVYINGEIMPGTPTVTNPTGTNVINFNDNPDLVIGARGVNASSASNDFCPASYSNFKLYDTALTAEEVKTLYDMGRTGSVANPQPLHIAAPLYSPGTIVQVDQVFTNNLGISTTSTSPIDITGLSITIQPKFANSKILVSYQLAIGSNYHAFVHIKRTQNGVTSYDVGRGAGSGFRQRASSYVSHLNSSHVCSENMEFLDSANGIDPITYQIQMWVASSSYIFILNRSISYGNSEYFATLGSSLTVKEICQ
jgi:hypothetical protein